MKKTLKSLVPEPEVTLESIYHNPVNLEDCKIKRVSTHPKKSK